MRERHESNASALKEKLFSTGALLVALVFCCPLLAYAYFGMEAGGALAEVTATTYLPELTISGIDDTPVKLEGTTLNTSITVSAMPVDGSAKEIQLSLRNAATGDFLPFQYELEVVPVLAAGQTAGPVAAFSEGTVTQENRPLCVAGELGTGEEQSVYLLRLTQAATLNIHLRTAFVRQTIRTATDFSGLRPQAEGAPFAPGTVIYLTQDIEASDEVLVYNENTGYPTLDLNGHKLTLKGLETLTESADTYALMEIRNGTLVVGEESFEFPDAQEAPMPYYAAENGGTVHLTLLNLGAAYYVAPAQPLAPVTPPAESPDNAVPSADDSSESAGNDGMGDDVDSDTSDTVSSAPPVSESVSGADAGDQANSESQPEAEVELPTDGESGVSEDKAAEGTAVQEVPAGTLQMNGETLHVIA